MTDYQMQKIEQMRTNGQSYLEIAKTLLISENTVKSYCRRNNIGIKQKSEVKVVLETNIACKYCRKELT